MGIFTYPREGIRYRIRNVDYGEYLEQRPSESTIVLRQEKEDPVQHWIFVAENSKKHTYTIYDVEQNSMLYVNSSNKIVFDSPSSSSSSDRTIWKLITDPLKDQRTYLVDEDTYMLYMKDRDHAEMKAETNEYNVSRTRKTQNYQWEIIEDSPSELPPGQSQHFRIRTLNGQALQLDGTSDKLTLDTQDRKGNHRTWLITDLGNGKCTIFNQNSKKYLCVRDKGSYNWEPTALADDNIANEENKIWIIEPTSDFTYSFSQECDVWVGRNLTSQTFSLALDNNTAILKPKKAAHNQIWLIEPEDAVEPSDSGDKNDPNQVSPGLSPGEYKLKNADTVPYYVKIIKKNNAYSVVTCPAQSANKFQVKSQGSGVIIYCRLNGKDIYLSADSGGSIVGREATSYTWKVTQADKANSYYIVSVPLNCSMVTMIDVFVLGMIPTDILALPVLPTLRSRLQQKARVQSKFGNSPNYYDVSELD
ncbi:hypothetical protein M378DRAFT_200813 [Amanita muscaria Koide BX008]|uniref:Uncharacterized protein n=1 Tax=Amanita muscaria (strain Koide BX008) TaxID=946122 RepID=A0A0C2STF0_AMAMK|nr:hypothetical protein M378DRAFT_200813 [Amanita muscaria Koide BX008]